MEIMENGVNTITVCHNGLDVIMKITVTEFDVVFETKEDITVISRDTLENCIE